MPTPALAHLPVTHADLDKLRADLVAEIRTVMNPESLLRLPKVEEVTGYRRASIYAKMREGVFPLPVDLGGRATAWRLSDIQRWIASRASAEPSVRKMPQPMRKSTETANAA